MAEREIKPCPGCLHAAEVIFDKRFGHVVECLICDMRGSCLASADPEAAIILWNALPRYSEMIDDLRDLRRFIIPRTANDKVLEKLNEAVEKYKQKEGM